MLFEQPLSSRGHTSVTCGALPDKLCNAVLSAAAFGPIGADRVHKPSGLKNGDSIYETS